MKKGFIALLLLLVPLMWVEAKKLAFAVEGPEERYNQIRVVNETSQENFRCRVVVLNDDDSTKEIFGIYELKERGDSDSNTYAVYRGERIGIEMPKGFPVEVSFYVEYRDYPLFDVVVIHLTDGETEFDEE